MTKYEQIVKLIRESSIEDLPAGNTIVNIDEDSVDLLSNIDSEQDMYSTIDTLLSVNSKMILEVLRQAAAEGLRISDIANDFVEAFQITLMAEIIKNDKLVDAYLNEIKEVLDEEKDTDEVSIDTSKTMRH